MFKQVTDCLSFDESNGSFSLKKNKLKEKKKKQQTTSLN